MLKTYGMDKKDQKVKKKGYVQPKCPFLKQRMPKANPNVRIGPANRSRFILDFILNVSNSITDTM